MTGMRVLLVRGGSPRAWLYATGVRARRAAVLLAKRRLPGLRALRDRLRWRRASGPGR